MAKKQGKTNISRTVVFRPKASYISCTKDYIKWIDFIGIFLFLVTDKDRLKIIAINLSDKRENMEIYFLIN